MSEEKQKVFLIYFVEQSEGSESNNFQLNGTI